eukprot:5054726-Prorocentrum_lima.AAC.1
MEDQVDGVPSSSNVLALSEVGGRVLGSKKDLMDAWRLRIERACRSQGLEIEDEDIERLAVV